MAARTVLVAGVSGVVGYAAARRFAADADVRVIGVSRRPPEGLDGVELHSVDLMDADACQTFSQELTDVTHLVYAALYEMPGLVPGWFEQEQMQTNLTMLSNLFEPLSRAATNLEHVSLLQGTKAYGAHVEPMRVPGRERSPRHQHPNFYWLQEDLLRSLQHEGRWGLTIWRPVFIFGESMGSHMNAIPAIGVYAALLRAGGQPLHYPGGVAPLFEAVDADLLADAMCWAAGEPVAHNQTFNITNGDVFTLRNVWPAIADAFGMDEGDDVPCSLGATMPGRQDEWANVVAAHDLRSPVDLHAFVGQSFIYADLIGGFGATEPSPPALLSTIKLRHAGFGACVDTEDMFQRIIARYQERRLLPPRLAGHAGSLGQVIAEPLTVLEDELRRLGRVVVAFSGGADSAFLATVATRVLGDRAHAVTAVSPSLASDEQTDCRALAIELGLRWTPVVTHEMERAAYRSNDTDRCFHCKAELMEVLTPIAAADDSTVVLGVNVDDLGDHRPGQRAASERGAQFPLVTAGFTKAMIRDASRRMGLRTWDKPAAACLASRIPYGTEVSIGLLSQVDRAEAALRRLGLAELRVRHYGDTARLEVPVDAFPAVLTARTDVIDALKQCGYRYVTLDLEGFRSGNLNDGHVLSPSKGEQP